MAPVAAFVAALATVIAVPAVVAPPSDSEPNAPSTASSPEASSPESSAPASSAPASSAPETAPPMVVDVSKTIPGVPPTIPGSVPDHASLDQVIAAAQSMIGPTDDLLGEFGGVIGTPADVPTPAGSEIIEFYLTLEPGLADSDPETGYTRGSVTFTSTATPDDIVEFYEALLPAAGYPQEESTTSSDSGGRQRVLKFDNPAASYLSASITVTVSDEGDDGEPPHHEVTWYSDIDRAWLDRLSGWTPGLPLAPGARPTDATLSWSSFLDITSMTVEIAYALPGTDATTYPQLFTAQLPAGGYDIDPDGGEGDGWTDLVGPGLDSLTIFWSESPGGVARARLSGRIVL